MLVICGPTTSGKSYIAHYIAKICNGEIVNADSKQIYKQIPIITASPKPEYYNELPYHLYNFLLVNQEFSVVEYAKCATKKILNIVSKNKLPIVVGGSGLYINALLFGYNEIPAISTEIKQYVKNLYEQIGIFELFNKLSFLDKISGEKLYVYDVKRVIRAYEVFLQTGKSIFSFYSLHDKVILPIQNFKIFFLSPSRTLLYHMCNTRITKLFSDKIIIQEIKSLQHNFLSLCPSVLKTIGLQEVLSYLKNDITLSHAIHLMQIKTRRYAKRQITWFKHQIQDKVVLEYDNSTQLEALIDKIISNL